MKYTDYTFRNMEHHVGGPGFRWTFAQKNAGLQRRSWAQNLDEPTLLASAYLQRYEQVGRERADREYPTVSAACTLFRNEQAFQTLKISLLGNLPRGEVATRLGVEQEIIEIAETLFFDIGELHRASGWINCHVFVPEARLGSMELAAKMKLAYHGGPVMARALLDGQENLPLDEAQRIVDQETLLYGKLQAALEFDLDANLAAEFTKNYLEYDLARRKMEFEREKFQHNCELARERCAGDAARQNDAESPSGELSDDSTGGDHGDRYAGAESAKDAKFVA